MHNAAHMSYLHVQIIAELLNQVGLAHSGQWSWLNFTKCFTGLVQVPFDHFCDSADLSTNFRSFKKQDIRIYQDYQDLISQAFRRKVKLGMPQTTIRKPSVFRRAWARIKPCGRCWSVKSAWRPLVDLMMVHGG